MGEFGVHSGKITNIMDRDLKMLVCHLKILKFFTILECQFPNHKVHPNMAENLLTWNVKPWNVKPHCFSNALLPNHYNCKVQLHQILEFFCKISFCSKLLR